MTFEEMLDHAIARLQRRGRLTYGTLKRQFQLDDAALDDLKDALLYAYPEGHDDAGRGLIWSGAPGLTSSATAASAPAGLPAPAPLTYPPPYLAEKIFTSRSALEGERKQVTVLFADLKGSMALLADRDPEEARQLLDPVLERLITAVHRLPHEPLQSVIRDIGGGTRPPHNQPPLIQQQTPFAPDNPAMVREAFAAHLRRTAALAHGVDQRDPIRVDDAEDRRSGQADLRPVVMRREKTKEPGPLGEAGKQRPIVTRQPAIEGPVAHAFEGMQQPQGHHRTGPEVRLRMCGDGAHLLIDRREQGSDKLHGAHAALLSWEGCHVPSMEEASDDCKPEKCILVVCKVL
jgi:hypothetical protein